MTTTTDLSCLEGIAPLVTPHEDAIAQNAYDVKTWVGYLDALDDWIQEDEKSNNNAKNNNNNNKAQALRQWKHLVGRRAVKMLPRSLKLWKLHWEFVLKDYYNKDNEKTSPTGSSGGSGSSSSSSSSSGSGGSKNVQQILDCFEQALTTLSSFPRVWMVYLQFLFHALQEQANRSNTTTTTTTTTTWDDNILSVTFCRRTINRALQALPVQQHKDKLWKPVLLPFLLNNNNNTTTTTTTTKTTTLFPLETRARLLQRYVRLEPNEFTTEYGAWCERHGQWGRAAVAYQNALLSLSSSNGDDNDDKNEIWQAFGNVCVQHSAHVEAVGIPWEAMLRTALQQQKAATTTTTTNDNHYNFNNNNEMTPQVWKQGMVYHWLATAWVRRGAFDLARSTYEEGLAAVNTVRDFSVLYEAYLELEEGLLEHAVADLEQVSEENKDAADNKNVDDDDDDWDILLQTTATSPLADMELAVARAEHLTRRRPLLLNAVRLRQDPNNIAEWLERSKLYLADEQRGQAASALQEALQTVHPGRTGRSELVVALVQNVYEDLEQSRELLRQVTTTHQILITHADDLTTCWATWVELELRNEHWDEALSLARQSVAPNVQAKKQQKSKFRIPNLTKSLRLWDLLLDLEESLGTVQTTKDAYNRALETKAATVQHVLNYTSFLKEHKYFEESFRVYERGIELFAFPHAGGKLLWKGYLQDFLERYQENQIERTRDLFQRCLEACPAEECSEFFTMNGRFEEEHGLTKRALSVYQAMCQKVPAAEKRAAYQLYIAKTQKYLGVTATRDIYQEAIEVLEDQAAAHMCREFAEMETSLQQFERARAIWTYGAQVADPRRLPEFWKAWNDFEIAHGNEETFREMLRVKRNTEAAFSTTVNYNASGMNDTTEKMSQEEAMRRIANQEGVEVNDATAVAPAMAGFVAAAATSSQNKRTAQAANLEDVEERVAKLRKATGQESNDDGDEIDLDDIDAEIEEAAAEGAAAAVEDVRTKSVPAAVFGGLAKEG